MASDPIQSDPKPQPTSQPQDIVKQFLGRPDFVATSVQWLQTVKDEYDAKVHELEQLGREIEQLDSTLNERKKSQREHEAALAKAIQDLREERRALAEAEAQEEANKERSKVLFQTRIKVVSESMSSIYSKYLQAVKSHEQLDIDMENLQKEIVETQMQTKQLNVDTINSIESCFFPSPRIVSVASLEANGNFGRKTRDNDVLNMESSKLSKIVLPQAETTSNKTSLNIGQSERTCLNLKGSELTSSSDISEDTLKAKVLLQETGLSDDHLKDKNRGRVVPQMMSEPIRVEEYQPPDNVMVTASPRTPPFQIIVNRPSSPSFSSLAANVGSLGDKTSAQEQVMRSPGIPSPEANGLTGVGTKQVVGPNPLVQTLLPDPQLIQLKTASPKPFEQAGGSIALSSRGPQTCRRGRGSYRATQPRQQSKTKRVLTSSGYIEHDDLKMNVSQNNSVSDSMSSRDPRLRKRGLEETATSFADRMSKFARI